MSRRSLHRLVLGFGAAAAVLTSGCDSYNGAAPTCSGQQDCFAYTASNPADGSSVAGTLVFDEFPLIGNVSGTWAFESVGEARVASHPTGSGRFTGSSAIPSIGLSILGGSTSAVLEGDRTAVLIVGEWESGGRSGPFSATLRR